MSHVSPYEHRTIRNTRGRGGLADANDLDQPLLMLSPTDSYTKRDACESIFVCGGVGSGKTSGSGAAIRTFLLKNGFGGIVMVAKDSEIDQWIMDARACGREKSLIIFDEQQGFNFLDYQIRRYGPDAIGNIVEFLMKVLEAARLSMASPGHVGDAFWENSTRTLLRMTIPALYAAYGTVRIEDIIRFVATAPTSPAQLHDEGWREASFMYRTFAAARLAPVVPIDQEASNRIAEYWQNEFAALDAKSRGPIVMTLSTTLDRFMHGRLNRAFCQRTTLVPELTFHGAVIICAMPTLTWHEDGIIGQQLFKLAFQRAVLSRNALAPEHRNGFVFCYADEAQNFVSPSSDPDFLSMSRSSRCATVYLTQSLPTIYAKMGSENAKHRADMLLANFGTKVFHNNSDPQSNQWAAETLGREIHYRSNFGESENTGWSSGLSVGEGWNSGTSTSFSTSTDARGGVSRSSSFGTSSGYNESDGSNRGSSGGQGTSRGQSEVMDWSIEPGEFGRSLKTGGRSNGGIVSAVWFQAGKRFNASGRNWLEVSFQQ